MKGGAASLFQIIRFKNAFGGEMKAFFFLKAKWNHFDAYGDVVSNHQNILETPGNKKLEIGKKCPISKITICTMKDM